MNIEDVCGAPTTFLGGLHLPLAIHVVKGIVIVVWGIVLCTSMFTLPAEFATISGLVLAAVIVEFLGLIPAIIRAVWGIITFVLHLCKMPNRFAVHCESCVDRTECTEEKCACGNYPVKLFAFLACWCVLIPLSWCSKGCGKVFQIKRFSPSLFQSCFCQYTSTRAVLLLTAISAGFVLASIGMAVGISCVVFAGIAQSTTPEAVLWSPSLSAFAIVYCVGNGVLLLAEVVHFATLIAIVWCFTCTGTLAVLIGMGGRSPGNVGATALSLAKLFSTGRDSVKVYNV